jgi:hypothetical protein
MAVLVTAIHVFAKPSLKDVDARHKAGHDGVTQRARSRTIYPSTVFPLLITATLRALTRASNEITLPSFHRSSVTVSPG